MLPVLRLVAELTGATELEVSQPLAEQGIDSVAAFELSSRLTILAGVSLPYRWLHVT